MPIPVLATLLEAVGLDPVEIGMETLFPDQAQGDRRLIESPSQSPDSVLPILAMAGIKQSPADVRYKEAIDRIDEAVRTGRFDKKGMKEYVKQISKNFNVDEADLAKVAKHFEDNLDLGDSLLTAADKPRVLEAGIDKIKNRRGAKVFKDIAKKVEAEKELAVPVGKAYTEGGDVVKASPRTVGNIEQNIKADPSSLKRQTDLAKAPNQRVYIDDFEDEVKVKPRPDDINVKGTVIEPEWRAKNSMKDMPFKEVVDDVVETVKKGDVEGAIKKLPSYARTAAIIGAIGAIGLGVREYFKDKKVPVKKDVPVEYEDVLVPIEKKKNNHNEFLQLERKLNEAYEQHKKSGRR